jgi:lysyl-tRNA synthetase, class II
MRRLRPRPEFVFEIATAAVGFISIVSALTPSIASRSELVQGVLPPGMSSTAKLAALVLGFALIWVSRSLALRKRRAWQLAVALVLGTAAAHLAKGFDVEEATVSLLVFVGLVRYRRRFDVPGDPSTLRPLFATSFALASLAGFLALYQLHRLSTGDGLEDTASALALLLASLTLYLWLKPWRERIRQDVDERRLVGRLIDAHGGDSLAFFALRRDKNYFFSATGRSFLAYRVLAGAALVSGDPIGDQAEFAQLLEQFRELARTRGWRLAVLGASNRLLPLYGSIGLRKLRLGEEAIVQPGEFSLEGRAIRKVRQSVHRLQRAGYRASIIRASELDPSRRSQLEDASNEWRGSSPERGFTMAMDDLFAGAHTVFAVAEDAEGQVGGFLHLVPCPAGESYSLSAMRRRPTSPNGLMEFLVAETIAWARSADVSELSLNFCVFADLLSPASARSPARRALRFVLLQLDRAFQLDRLRRFNSKFSPEWRPRFVCLERLTDVPRVGIAYLQAESLLIPPGPWARPRPS